MTTRWRNDSNVAVVMRIKMQTIQKNFKKQRRHDDCEGQEQSNNQLCNSRGPHLDPGPIGWSWRARRALPHMLASWRAGKCSSACAREFGNEPSAYSPHPGSTPLSERHRPDQATPRDRRAGKWWNFKDKRGNFAKSSSHVNIKSVRQLTSRVARTGELHTIGNVRSMNEPPAWL